MNEILQIIGFACVGHLVTDFISHFELPSIPDKPFRCDMCMTYWISVIPFMLQFGLYGILYAGISAVTANILYKYI